ncbi:Sphingolipid long chain base-responsive protein PIL1, partial [Dissostichus eleginoides]
TIKGDDCHHHPLPPSHFQISVRPALCPRPELANGGHSYFDPPSHTPPPPPMSAESHFLCREQGWLGGSRSRRRPGVFGPLSSPRLHPASLSLSASLDQCSTKLSLLVVRPSL